MTKKRIAVISDTHGVVSPLAEALRGQAIDEVFFLGDSVEDGRALLTQLHVPGHLVYGNIERQVLNEPPEEVVVRHGHRILLAHGHRYGVKSSLTRLWYRAMELSCSLVLYGHTHEPQIEEKEKVIFFNPGSAGRPCWTCEAPSWGLLEIDEHEIHCRHIYY